MKPDKCPVCGIKFDQPWHDSNGWQFRMGLGLDIPPRTNTNCCHCPHRDCVSTSCEEYHEDRNLLDYGSIYHQITLLNYNTFTKEYLRTIGFKI